MKLFIFSSFFLGVASLLSPSFAMASDDVGVQPSPATHARAIEDLRGKKIRILRKALSDCDQFIAFEEDFLETCQNQSQFDISFEGIAYNIEAIRRVKRFLVKYQQSGKDEEYVLTNLLDLRFQLLISRRKVMKEFHSQAKLHQKGLLPPNTRKMIFGPTKPELFDALDPVTQLFSRIATDRYQFFNQVILHVWQLVDSRTLRPKTKLKIRASTSLWDTLTGKRDYLGHPDEAIPESEGGRPYKTDCQNYDNYIEEHEVKDIPLLGWGKGKFTSAYETLYSRSLWDQSWSRYKTIKDAPYPDWLKPLPKKDVVTPPVQEAPKMPRSKSPTQIIKTPPSTEGKDAYDIKQDPILESPAPETLEISRSISPAPVKLDAPIALKETPEEVSVAPIVDANKEIKMAPTPPFEPVRPRGMRLFHHEFETQQKNTNISPLKGNHLSVHQQIFDKQQFKKVTYGQFKALWKHICGPESVIESSGSSHKKLMGPNKEVFGTFAHSDGMNYSHRTISYIRDALNQIGYGGEHSKFVG